MYTKPLYQAEKEIEYQKHLQRLKQIGKKRAVQIAGRDVIQEMHKIRHMSSDFHTKEKSNSLNLQNNKILTKIIEIAERKEVPAYSTVASHIQPQKNRSLVMFENPERKRRQREILEGNNKLAKRLLTKQSEFDRNKTMKTIEDYQTTKKILQNNRRVRLVPVSRGEGHYDFTRLSTVQHSRVSSQEAKKILNGEQAITISHQPIKKLKNTFQ